MKTSDTKPTTTAVQQHSSRSSRQAEHDVIGVATKSKTTHGNGSSHSVVQAKLTIGEPNDKYEQEADAIAERVVQRLPLTDQSAPTTTPVTTRENVQAKCTACEKEEEQREEGPVEIIARKAIFESNEETPAAAVQKKCDACEKEEQETNEEKVIAKKPAFDSDNDDDNAGVQRKCASCEKEEALQKKENPAITIALKCTHCAADEDENEKGIQRKEQESPTPAAAGVESTLVQSKGGGTPLPVATRRQMESHFVADFSGVRIHDNSVAHDMSKSLHAQAFTHGNDIYFNSGKYDTTSKTGQQLLAHELTHTIQQGASKGMVQHMLQRDPEPTPGPTETELLKNGILLEDEDKKTLVNDNPGGIKLHQQDLFVLIYNSGAASMTKVPGFRATPVGKAAGPVEVYIFQVGKGRAIMISSKGSESIMLDAGSGGSVRSGSQAARRLATFVNDVLQAGLANPPTSIRVSHIDADHYNALTSVLNLARLSNTTIQLTRQQLTQATAQGNWRTMNVQLAPGQSITQINIRGTGGLDVRKAIIGEMEVIEYRSVPAQANLSRQATTFNKNNTSPVTVVRDLVSNATYVFTADGQGRLLNEVINMVGEDAFRKIIGGGSRNLSLVEYPHHGGQVEAGNDTSGMIRFLRLQFEASDGSVNFFTQTSQNFANRSSSSLNYLNSIGINVEQVQGNQGGATIVRKQSSSGPQRLTINADFSVQFQNIATSAGTQITEAYRTRNKIANMTEQLEPMRQAAEYVPEEGQKFSSVLRTTGTQVEQMRTNLDNNLNRFWTEVENASRNTGLRGTSPATPATVQAELTNLSNTVKGMPLEGIENSLIEAIMGMNIQSRLFYNLSSMTEALRLGQIERLKTLKAEQSELLLQAKGSLGLKVYEENIRSSWNAIREVWTARVLKVVSQRLGKSEAQRQMMTDYRTVLGESVARQIQLNEMMHKAYEGQLPRAVDPATGQPRPLGFRTRAGAGFMAALEVIRIGLELAHSYKESSEATEARKAAEKIDGYREVAWWNNLGIAPKIKLVKRGWFSGKYSVVPTGNLDPYRIIRNEVKEGVPEYDRVVVSDVTDENLKTVIGQFNLRYLTLQNWLDEMGHPDNNNRMTVSSSNIWFVRKDGQWSVKLWSDDEGAYVLYAKTFIQQPLTDLFKTLEKNQTNVMQEQVQKAGGVKVIKNSAWKFGVDRIAYVFNSYGKTEELDFEDFIPEVTVLGTNHYLGRAMTTVKAANNQTYNALSKYYWTYEAGRYAGGNCLSCVTTAIEPNHEGKAIVEPGHVIDKEQPPPPVQKKEMNGSGGVIQKASESGTDNRATDISVHNINNANNSTPSVQCKTSRYLIQKLGETDRHQPPIRVEVTGNKIRSKDYAVLHAANIIQLLTEQIPKNIFAVPVPQVSWVNGNSEKFSQDLWSNAVQTKKDIHTLISELIVPDAIQIPINAGRNGNEFDGTDEWKPGVVTELNRVLSRRIIMALRRVVPVYAIVMNKKQLANEQNKTSLNVEPAPDELVPAHPLDIYLIPALKGKLSINYPEYRKNFAAGYPQLPKAQALRPVQLEFQVDHIAPNWVKVLNPIDATKEEVANELYGTSTKAWALTGNGPFYGIYEHGRTDELYKMVPKYEDPYQQNQDKYKLYFNKGVIPDPLTTGFVTQEIALSQAKAIQSSTASRNEILQRMQLIKHFMYSAMVIYPRIGAGAQLPTLEEEYTAFLNRYVGLIKATDEEVKKWDAQTIGQLSLVKSAYEGLAMAEQQYEVFKGFDKARLKITQLGFHYTKVIRYSDFYVTGKEMLDWANDQSLLFPAEVTEDVLAEVRQAIENARRDKTKTTDPKIREAIYDFSGLDAKEQDIRNRLVALRNLLLQDPEKARGILNQIFLELEDLKIGAELVTDMDAVQRAWKELYDTLSFMGEIRAIWGGGNEIISEALSANNTLFGEWSRIYIEWKHGDKEKAKKELKEKASSPEWEGYFKKVASIIEDHNVIDKWMNLGAMIGIAIFTAGLGAYVELYLGTAWGVANLTGAAALTSVRVWAAGAIAATTEAAVFTTLSTMVLEKDPSLSKYFDSFAENLVLFGGLKGLSKGYTAIVGAERAAAVSGQVGNMSLQFAAVNGHALWKANKEKNEKLGKSLTWEEIMDISLHNLAFMVAVTIGGKLAEGPMQSIILKGKLNAGLGAVRRAENNLLETSRKVQAAEGKNEKLNAELKKRSNELLRAQENLMLDLLKISLSPKLAKAAGLTPERIADIQKSLSGIQTALVLAQLEPIASNRFLCTSEVFDRAKEVYSAEKNTKVFESQRDPSTGMRLMEVVTPEKTIIIIERVSANKEAVIQEPKAATEPVPGETKTPEPAKADLSFDQRLEQILAASPGVEAPPYLKHSIRNLRNKNVPEETILAIVRNGFIHSDRPPAKFFSDLNSLATSKAGKNTINLIAEGLASDRNFFAARMLMETASWNQALKVRNILDVFTIEDIGGLRLRFPGDTDANFITALDLITRSVEGNKDTIFTLLKEAGESQAALDSLVDAVSRLGKGKFTAEQVRESLKFDTELKEAIANNAQADALARIIFGEKYGGKQGDTYQVSKGLTKTKNADLASAHIRARKSQIASAILGGDKGIAINDITWGVIKNIIRNTDLPIIVQNDIIGELWAFSKVRQYENMGYTVIREVSVRWLTAEGTWSEGFAKIDAVIKRGNEVGYKEFKSSETASTSTEQDTVYDLLGKGETGKLKPFGERAEQAFGGPRMPDFKADKVAIERPK